MDRLEWLSSLIVLTGVWLTAKAKISGWFFGIAGSLLYTYICFSSRLYAESMLQLFYAGMGVFGWITWKHQSNLTIMVRKIPVLLFSLTMIVWLFFTLLVGFILEHYSNTDIPYSDASMTAAGLVLTWQMAQRYIECWSGWIIVNLFSSIIFIHKELYPTAGLYLILALLAWYGHLSWKRQLRLQ